MERDHSNDFSDQPRRRSSIFVETGLFEDTSTPERLVPHLYNSPKPSPVSPIPSPIPSAALDDVEEMDENEDLDISKLDEKLEEVADDDHDMSHFLIDADALRPYQRPSLANRLAALTVFMALAIPILQCTPILSESCAILPGVSGGLIRSEQFLEKKAELLEGRADYDPTNYCKRWSQQSALVNGTLYMYGGRSTTSASQTTDTWNNDFLSIDVTNTWQISSPSMSALSQPSGPPAVSLGYLWNSYDSVFLYGGEFSDTPVESPTAFSLWEYNLGNKQWYEHSNPQTSAGNNSEGDGQSVQRVAEGAGFSVPALGRGWYFGGHQDYLTTEGWSNQVARIYIKSLIEYTFPGYGNSAVQSLSDGKTAGSDGVWRNVTQGGLQESAGFTERADGILTYIPGFGAQGILLGLAGGTNATFTQMNVIDVYDIATSTWYKQATSGSTPGIRVNPCAVVAAAADGSSYQVHMFGGQNLIPYGNQTEYDDMWILTVPSFTWIQVDQSNQAVPYARSGHTCNIWDGQMIMVGGYIGTDIGCESPGVYIFNCSALSWQNQFTSVTGRSNGGSGGGSSNSDGLTQNVLSQQPGQMGTNSSSGLEGSYGYLVPEVVIKVIGGSPTGGATVTAPAQTPTAGPMATGKPITYTVTGPDGSTITETATPGGGSSSHESKESKVGIIVASVIAGIAFLVACYLGFCVWVYRRQVALYREHVSMAQRQAADPSRAEKEGFVLPPSLRGDNSGKNSSDQSRPTQASNSGGSGGDSSGTAAATPGSNAAGYERIRRWSQGSRDEDLLEGQEPTFWGSRGVLLNPTRSLRVINRD